jgi:hypothetical protein
MLWQIKSAESGLQWRILYEGTRTETEDPCVNSINTQQDAFHKDYKSQSKVQEYAYDLSLYAKQLLMYESVDSINSHQWNSRTAAVDGRTDINMPRIHHSPALWKQNSTEI